MTSKKEVNQKKNAEDFSKSSKRGEDTRVDCPFITNCNGPLYVLAYCLSPSLTLLFL